MAFTISTSPSSIPSRRDKRRSSDSSKASHISREGCAQFSQKPRRSRRHENVHRPANRSARTNRRLPVFGSVSSHLISILWLSAAQSVHEPHEVGWRGHLPEHFLAGRWMNEPKLGCVQGESRGAALVRDHRSVHP